MSSRMAQICILGVAAALLGGCQDPPLAPDHERALFGTSGAGLTAPSNLSAIAVSSGQIDLGWQDKSSNETGFELYRSTGGSGGAFARLSATGSNVTGYGDSGLTPSTPYCYRVRAFRKIGNKTSYSAFAGDTCATTLPPPGPNNPPTGLTAVAVDTRVTLRWADNSVDEEGFRVERSSTSNGPWTLRISTTANATIAEDWAHPEQELCYRVIGFNKTGNSAPSNIDCSAFLFAPSNPSATKVDDNTISLTWTNSSTLADAVEVYRQSETIPFSLVATMDATASVYRDAGLSPNATYWYKVRAKRQDDVSSFVLVTASTGTVPPNSPSGLLAYPASSTSVNVWWHHDSPNESGYRIEQSDDGGTSWRTIETINFANQGYWLNERAVTDKVVCYRVLAFNGAGDSPPSNFACTAPPAAATELTATRIDDMTVEINWRDNSGVEDGYDILKSTEGFTQWMEVIGHVGPNVTTFRDTAAPRFAYPYRVQPTRDGGVGTWSDFVDVGD